VQAVGRVAWTRTSIGIGAESPAGKQTESGIGIEFLGGPRDELVALERFIARSIRRRNRDRESPPGYVPIERG
jgi:hypothetical protein